MDMSNVNKKEKSIMGKAWPVMLCLLLSLGVFLFLLNMEKKELSKYEKGQAVIAAASIKGSTEITSENVKTLFKVSERPLTDIPDRAYVTVEELVGQYVQHDMDAGVVVTKSMTGELNPLQKDHVLLAVNMEALDRSVAGTLRAGDEIDLYTVETNAVKEVLVEKVLEKVKIIRSYTGTGGAILKEDAASIAQYITIPVHKDAVGTFYKALENKKIGIVKYPDKEVSDETD